ncbi:Trp biosynthesis-associated membrane protein [Pseudonocardia cypriaca]|uniref:Tryptophan-associated transmembrane protein n=1 Tax=Pseudonocardia cypriaca TaxID=882449 RepID=A0A543GF44_9PSEU|nr:Trp biosynthesis-associated membrane protein [Pseudonocardia cypriaca]TQM44700.1 tryptophan-associated transmembrane protein [Pseudonocardia cypriaca]
MTDRPSPRALGTACAGLVLSAVLLWAGSATVWYRVLRPGAAPVELTGASVAPWLGGTALLALAGVAGVVATGGVLRRLVGALLGLTGAGVLVLGVRALLTDPNATDATGAPLLAVAGALVLLAVGIAVLVRERRLPRLGARYAAPGERRVERDPDRAAWEELDEGRDPTVDPAEAPPGDAGDDPGDGPRSAPG